MATITRAQLDTALAYLPAGDRRVATAKLDELEATRRTLAAITPITDQQAQLAAANALITGASIEDASALLLRGQTEALAGRAVAGIATTQAAWLRNAAEATLPKLAPIATKAVKDLQAALTGLPKAAPLDAQAVLAAGSGDAYLRALEALKVLDAFSNLALPCTSQNARLTPSLAVLIDPGNVAVLQFDPLSMAPKNTDADVAHVEMVKALTGYAKATPAPAVIAAVAGGQFAGIGISPATSYGEVLVRVEQVGNAHRSQRVRQAGE